MLSTDSTASIFFAQLSRLKRVSMIALLLLLMLLFIHSIKEILTPFLLAFVLAYMLMPLHQYLTRWIPPTLSALLSTLLLLAIVVAFVIIVLPILSKELFLFVEMLRTKIMQLNPILEKEFLTKLLEKDFFSAESAEKYLQDLNQSLGTIIDKTTALIPLLLMRIWNSGKAILSLISLLLITPFSVFFILKDSEAIYKTCHFLIPKRYKTILIPMLHDIDLILSKYIRGQSQVCLWVGVYYCITLTLIGLRSSIFIGVLSGVIAFIPYIGFFSSLTLSMLSALNTSHPSLLAVGAVYLVGGIFENYVITPKLLQKHVCLHPLWIIFSLLAGYHLLGITGVLMAIPMTAVLSVVAKFVIRYYYTEIPHHP